MKTFGFLKINRLLLFLILIVILTISVYNNVLNEKHETNKKSEKNKENKENTIEGLYNKYSLDDALCYKYSDLSPAEELKNIDKDCNSLKESSCNSSKCCVWLNGEKCVGGDKSGPTWQDKNNKTKYYSWKNTCYGKC